jgi:hypothetical protein
MKDRLSRDKAAAIATTGDCDLVEAVIARLWMDLWTANAIFL